MDTIQKDDQESGMNTQYSAIAQGLIRSGHATVLLGGQWGSEAKGSAAAWLAWQLAEKSRCFDIVTTNAGAQAGHTSIHQGVKRVVFHLPTASLIAKDHFRDYGLVYLNAGSIIDPEGLVRELEENKLLTGKDRFAIHPMAAVITDECREAENSPSSSQTQIASTRKGVGQALSRKVLRSGMVAKDHPVLQQWVRRIDLNAKLCDGSSVLLEVPQGVSLSLSHSPFYPHTTSRDCTPMSALSDAGIHPVFMGKTMLVLRTFPIRVGNIVEGDNVWSSGDSYADQEEIGWADLGVEPEITTVTKRIRRVFTFSAQQARESIALCRPEVIMLTFCNYADRKTLASIMSKIETAARQANIKMPEILLEWGSTTEDVQPWPL